MSTDSLITIPPELVMVPRFVTKLNGSSLNETFYVNGQVCNSGDGNFDNLKRLSTVNQKSDLIKLSEYSFPVSALHPINVKIVLGSQNKFPLRYKFKVF